MALKSIEEADDEFSNDELSRAKELLTRQFKKFLKNVEVKTKDKDTRKSSFVPKNESSDRPRKEYKDAG